MTSNISPDDADLIKDRMFRLFEREDVNTLNKEFSDFAEMEGMDKDYSKVEAKLRLTISRIVDQLLK